MVMVNAICVAVTPAATAAREELGGKAGVTVWLDGGAAVAVVLLAGGQAVEGVAAGGLNLTSVAMGWHGAMASLGFLGVVHLHGRRWY